MPRAEGAAVGVRGVGVMAGPVASTVASEQFLKQTTNKKRKTQADDNRGDNDGQPEIVGACLTLE